MRREVKLTDLVHHHLFPHPTPTDPPDFSTHLSKNLVGEVRIETQRFYGSLESIEARYPGLNYSHAPHRKRLARFPHHARLFKAFDELHLTSHEISMICRWEGTLWARQRYERDEGVKVEDTTGDGISPWVDRRERSPVKREKAKQIKVETNIEVEVATAAQTTPVAVHTPSNEDRQMAEASHAQEDGHQEAHDEDDDEGDIRQQSIGDELHRRLVAAAEARNAGVDVSMDPLFEQYLKEATEGGAASTDDILTGFRAAHAMAAVHAASSASGSAAA